MELRLLYPQIAMCRRDRQQGRDLKPSREEGDGEEAEKQLIPAESQGAQG